jgi:hypothetical protein
MTSPHPATEAWARWWAELETLANYLRQGKGAIVSSPTIREQTKLVVQYYFREVRPHLIALAIREPWTDQLDLISQHLLKLASKPNRRTTYRGLIHELGDLRSDIETVIEIRSTDAGGPRRRALRQPLSRRSWRLWTRSFPLQRFPTGKYS